MFVTTNTGDRNGVSIFEELARFTSLERDLRLSIVRLLQQTALLALRFA